MKKKGIQIFIISLIVFFVVSLSSKEVFAASFSFAKTGKIVKNGDFDLAVMMDTNKENVNAFESNIAFDPQFLEVTSIKPGSVFTFLLEKTFDNDKGTIRVIGGLPSPGFDGIGESFVVNFHAKNQTGETSVYFIDNNNKILSNVDNKDVFASSENASLEIVENKDGTNIQADTAEKTKSSNSFSNGLLFLGMTNAMTLLAALLIVLAIKKSKQLF